MRRQVRPRRRAAVGGRGAPGARARPPSRAAAAAGLHVFQAARGPTAPGGGRCGSAKGAGIRLCSVCTRPGIRCAAGGVLQATIPPHAMSMRPGSRCRAPSTALGHRGGAGWRACRRPFLLDRRRPPGPEFDGAEEAGLLRKLTKALAPESDAMRPDWKVGDLLATYYRWVDPLATSPAPGEREGGGVGCSRQGQGVWT